MTLPQASLTPKLDLLFLLLATPKKRKKNLRLIESVGK